MRSREGSRRSRRRSAPRSRLGACRGRGRRRARGRSCPRRCRRGSRRTPPARARRRASREPTRPAPTTATVRPLRSREPKRRSTAGPAWPPPRPGRSRRCLADLGSIIEHLRAEELRGAVRGACWARPRCLYRREVHHVLEAIAICSRSSCSSDTSRSGYRGAGGSHARRVQTRAVSRRLLRLIRWLERHSRPRGRIVFGAPGRHSAFGGLAMSGLSRAFVAPPFSGLDTLPPLGVRVRRSVSCSKTADRRGGS